MKKKRSKLIPILPLCIGSILLFSCGQPNPSSESQITSLPTGKGLDAILGEEGKQRPQSIVCSEDAYVLNGANEGNDSININFGNGPDLFLKGHTSGNKNERIIFLKFDLSGLKSRSITFASLGLYCYSAENSDETTINVYGTSALFWDEQNITYSSMPALGSIVASKKQKGAGYISFDLTPFLKQLIARGTDSVSFAIKNEPIEENEESPRRFSIRSREATSESERPKIDFSFGKATFTTDLKDDGSGINPWDYAMDEVEDYFARAEDIKSKASEIVSPEVPEIDENEYTLSVDAAKANQTNGDETVYTAMPTRTMDTLRNYVENDDESSSYDVYGGLKDSGLSLETTGYFHTEIVNGRHYVVDPLGNPYYRTAMNAISSNDDHTRRVLTREYGSLDAFYKAESSHLMNDLGFNSAGSWSEADSLMKNDSMISISTILNLASEYGKEVGLNNTTGGSTTFVNGVMPLFDPGFETFAKERASKLVTPYKDNPLIFGWFLDNELEASLSMLDNFLRVDYEDPTSNFSYAVAYTYLYKKLGKTLIFASDINDDLRKDFRAMVYERYFHVAVNAIKEIDANHMIVGCRFLRNCYEDESVMKVAGYYNDIISFNYYNTWTPVGDFLENAYRWSAKPFMITEWYAKGMDACTPENGLTNQSGAGWTVRTQEDRGKFYQNYALRLMEAKHCVGFDYFKMWDNNPKNTGADTSNTNSNKGIYDIDHHEYVDLTKAMKRMNLNKYSLIRYFDER